MRVLITHARFLLGGSETYAVTAAEQLERLGHTADFFAGEVSPQGRELLASRGLAIATGEPTVLADRDDFDVVLAQDAASAYALASRREVPLVFVIHGFAFFEHPPQALQPPPPVMVMNDRMADHAAGLASKPEVVRLRQPIDIQRFKPRPAREKARRVLVFSNYLEDDRMAMLQEVCDDLGLELTTMGVRTQTSITPQDRIAEADIVVGYGRSVLEAMAMGRAAYVWERAGGDGWVTPETYSAIEADGFSGAATDAIIDMARLREDFSAYRSELGPLGVDLVRTHHSATLHADALVQLLGRVMPEGAAPDPIHETLGLLVRAGTRANDDANKFEYQLRVRAEEVEHLRERIGELAPLEPALAEATANLEAERERRAELEEQVQEALGSISWRLTGPLRTLMRWLRVLRGR